jgi:hypothetical protein
VSRLTFPADLFHLREGEQPMYGEFPDLKRGVEYFKSLMTPEDWVARRAAVAKRFYQSLIGELDDPTGKGKFFKDGELFDWYLFLGEAFTDHPWNYEVIYGCRVVPILAAIGRELNTLTKIEGFRERAVRLVGQGTSQPNGPLFEMLVAAAYARAGAKTVMRPETPGQSKSYDLDVELKGKRWAVECKRMEAGEYADGERQCMRELWKAPCLMLVAEQRNSILDVNFKVELSAVPEGYLLQKVQRFLRRCLTSYMWSDNIALGTIDNLDIEPVQKALERNYLLHPSPQFTKILTGSYRRDDGMLSMYRIRYASNPHFIDELDLAVVARWSSRSEEAVNKKARDILKRLSDAVDQLPTNVAGVTHIGFEALGEDEIEKRRYEKILETARTFDREKSKLEFVYYHYFAPDPSPEETWAIDETVQWFGVSPKGRPLENGKVLPSDDGGRPGVHWDKQVNADGKQTGF